MLVTTLTALLTPIVSYKLSCPINQTLVSLSKVDSLTGPLRANDPSIFDCDDLYRDGFVPRRNNSTTAFVNSTYAPIMESGKSLKYLKEHFLSTNAKGFAVELWFVPVDDPMDVPLFTIGQRKIALENVTQFSGKCNGYELLIQQHHQELLVSYSDDDVNRSCRTLPLRRVQMVPGQLTHAVVTFSANETNAYVNGKPSGMKILNRYNTRLESWNPDYAVQLFSNKVVTNDPPEAPRRVFTGAIHRFALYDQHLSDTDVAAAYRSGFAEIVGLLGTSINNLTVVEGMTSETTFAIGTPERPLKNHFWTTSIQIVSVPAHGNLVLASQDEFYLTNGSVIDNSETGGYVNFQYIASEDTYFNTPSTTSRGQTINESQPESFTYRILAIHRITKELISTSSIIVQPIFVVNINHRPTLSVPKSATAVQDQDTIGSIRKFVLNDIHLEDIDRNVDKVRVTVWSENGSLYLNEGFLELADFNDCSSRYLYKSDSNWKCQGRGQSDRNMTFVAQPDDVNKLLNGMVYSPFYDDQEDFIYIMIFDGQGGDCLVKAEHEMYGNVISSVRNGCLNARARIHVPTSQSIVGAEEKKTPNGIEKVLRLIGVKAQVNLVTMIWWIVIVISMVTLYENCLQCLGSCFGCCLSQKCLAWFSIASWCVWLCCCCGACKPTEHEDDWPEDEEISAIHIRDGFLYEKSKHRQPVQWRKTPIEKIV